MRPRPAPKNNQPHLRPRPRPPLLELIYYQAFPCPTPARQSPRWGELIDILDTFIYDGDPTPLCCGGRRRKMVKAEIDDITTLYVSSAYQITNGAVTKYYPGGAFRVNGILYYALSDHPFDKLRTTLGSTSVTTNANGAKLSEMR